MLAFNIVEHSYFDAILLFVNPSQLTQASSCSLCPAQVIALSVPTFGSDGDVARKSAVPAQLQVAASPADPVFICESGPCATSVAMLPGSGKAAARTVFLASCVDSIANERCQKTLCQQGHLQSQQQSVLAWMLLYSSAANTGSEIWPEPHVKSGPGQMSHPIFAAARHPYDFMCRLSTCLRQSAVSILCSFAVQTTTEHNEKP